VDAEAPQITHAMPVVNESSPYLYYIENGTGHYLFYSSLMTSPQPFWLNGTTADSGSGLKNATASTAFGDAQTVDLSPSSWSWMYDVEAVDTGNGTITLTFKDNVGNIATFILHYVEDNTPPAINASIVDDSSDYIHNLGMDIWYGTTMAGDESFTIELVIIDEFQSGIQDITFPAFFGDNETVLTSGPYVMTYTLNSSSNQTGPLEIVLRDMVGNTHIYTYWIHRDTNAPTYIGYHFDDTSPYLYWNGTTLWYGDKMLDAENATIILTGVADADSGIRAILYPAFWGHAELFTNDTERTYAIDSSDTETGIFTIVIYDNVNQETIIEIPINRDTNAPTILASTIIENSNWLHYNYTGLFYGSGMGALAQSFYVNGSGGDTESGLYKVTFSTAFGDMPADDLTPEWWNAHYTVLGGDTGNGTITVTLWDNVGNNATWTFNYYEDNTEPYITGLVLTPESPAKAGNLQIFITFSEAMDTNRSLDAQMGFASPYDTYGFTGTWLDSRTWVGNLTITPAMPNGAYTILVSGAGDRVCNIMADDTNYSVTVDTIAEPVLITNIADNDPIGPGTIIHYTLGENMSEAYIIFERIGGAPDNSTPHIYALTGEELLEGNHSIDLDWIWINPESLYNITLAGLDLAGNPASYKVLNVLYDTTPPVTSPILNGTMGNNGWYVSNTSIDNWNIADASSVQIYYSLNGGNWTLFNATLYVNGSGIHALKYYGIDQVGNEEAENTLLIYIDIDAPETTIIPLGTLLGGWYAELSIQLDPADSHSGPNATYYSLDSDMGPWTPYTTPFVLGEGVHTVYYYSEDNGGNEENVKNATFQVDHTPPTTTHLLAGTMGNNGWYTTDVVITLTASDAHSGVNATYYSLNGATPVKYTGAVTITTSGIHTLTFYSMDNVTNREDNQTITIKVDKIAPATTHTIAGTLGSNGWYRTAATITLSASDAHSGMDNTWYSLVSGTGPWTAYSGTFLLGEGEHTVYYRSRDNAGNNETVNSFSIKIDVTAPATTHTIAGTLGGDNWYVTNVQVTLTPADATSGVATTYYRLNGAPQETYSGPILLTLNGEHTIQYWSVDNAGNTEAQKTVSARVDKLAPSTSRSIAGTYDSVTGWYKSTVTVTLTASDAHSGIDYTQYRLDGGLWNPYQLPFEITAQGDTLLEYGSVDKAGNVETLHSITIWIDTSKPVTTLNIDSGDLGEQGWYLSDVVFSLSAADNMGIAGTWYDVDATGTYLPYVGPVTVSGLGTHTIYYYSKDLAGNVESTKTATIRIDNQPPTASISLSGTLGSNGWYTASVTASITGNDQYFGSGIKELWYRLDGGSWNTYSSSITIGHGMHVLEARAMDKAGNNGTIAITNINVDTNRPVTTHSIAGTLEDGGWYTTNVEVTLDAQEPNPNGSGIAQTRYRIGGVTYTYTGPFIISSDGTWELRYWSIDNAGNTEAQNIITVKVDKNPPQPPVGDKYFIGTASSNGWYLQNVSITLGTYTDATSGLNRMEYNLNGAGWKNYTGSISVNGAGTHNLLFRPVDNAGNIGAMETVNIRIDLMAPTGSASAAGTIGENGWYTSPVTITITAADDASATTTTYKLNGGATTPYAGPFAVALEGSHTISYTITDEPGRTFTGQYNFKIDTQAPVINSFSTTGANVTNQRNVSMSLSTTDATSGPWQYRTRTNGGAWSMWSPVQSSFFHSLPEAAPDGLHQVDIEVMDQAGWTTTATTSILLDTTPPATTLAVPISSTTRNLDIPYVVIEAGSGLQSIKYEHSADGIVWNTISVVANPNPVELVEGNNWLRAWTIDNAGNGAYSPTYFIMVDSIAPTATAVIAPEPSPATVDGMGAHLHPDGTLVITYSEPMDTTLEPNVFYEHGGPVPITGAWTGPTTWTGQLQTTTGMYDAFQGQLAIEISGARDLAGNVQTPAAATWSVDAIPPTIISLVASPGPVIGEEDVTITVVFSKTMSPGVLDVTLSTISTNTPITGNWLDGNRWQGTTIIYHGIGDGPASLQV
ncbi:MAG: hypothetical protein QCI38_02690, partial [Candidatus Thermoplasmatota archaeon]|nr:hypothetical protein [Candidatus Thermoplasmatota archaeon]